MMPASMVSPKINIFSFFLKVFLVGKSVLVTPCLRDIDRTDSCCKRQLHYELSYPSLHITTHLSSWPPNSHISLTYTKDFDFKKGLGHQIDFKYFDKNSQSYTGLNKGRGWSLILQRLLCMVFYEYKSQPNSALSARNFCFLFKTKDENLENLETCRGPYLDLDLYIHVIKSRIYPVTQSL